MNRTVGAVGLLSQWSYPFAAHVPLWLGVVETIFHLKKLKQRMIGAVVVRLFVANSSLAVRGGGNYSSTH